MKQCTHALATRSSLLKEDFQHQPPGMPEQWTKKHKETLSNKWFFLQTIEQLSSHDTFKAILFRQTCTQTFSCEQRGPSWLKRTAGWCTYEDHWEGAAAVIGDVIASRTQHWQMTQALDDSILAHDGKWYWTTLSIKYKHFKSTKHQAKTLLQGSIDCLANVLGGITHRIRWRVGIKAILQAAPEATIESCDDHQMNSQCSILFFAYISHMIISNMRQGARLRRLFACQGTTRYKKLQSAATSSPTNQSDTNLRHKHLTNALKDIMKSSPQIESAKTNHMMTHKWFVPFNEWLVHFTHNGRETKELFNILRSSKQNKWWGDCPNYWTQTTRQIHVIDQNGLSSNGSCNLVVLSQMTKMVKPSAMWQTNFQAKVSKC